VRYSDLLVENREIFIPHLYVAPPRGWRRRNFVKMRLIVRKQKFDRTTLTLRDNLYWLPVDKRIEFKLCLLVFKCQHQMAPPYLASVCVQLLADTRSRQLRSAARDDLMSRTRTASYGPRSFVVSGSTCWNSLPPQLKSASLTLQQFCDRLKTVLFSRSYAS